MDCSPPGSSIHGIFQARVLEWGAISFSGNLLLEWAIIEKLRRNEYGVFTRDIMFVIIQYLLLNTYYVPGMMKTFLHALFNLIFKARYEIDSTIFFILLMK